MKRRLAVLLTVMLVAAGAPLRAADEPYDLYAVMSLTGQFAFVGRGEAQTLPAIEKYVNAHGGIRGRPLHFIVLDDQSNPTIALQVANQVIAKGVAAFLGPMFGPNCAAVEPLVLANGPVEYCLASITHPPAGSYSFNLGPAAVDIWANAYRYLKAKGVRKLALLASTDTTGQDVENSTAIALQYPDLRDVKLVATEHFAPTDISVAAQVARIKASGAEAILAATSGTPFGTIARNVYEAGYDGYLLTSAANAVKEQLAQYASFLPSKTIFTTLAFQMTVGAPPRVAEARKACLDALKEVGIAAPSTPNFIPWDASMIFVDGLRKFGPQASATQMRDYIFGLHDYDGINGAYDFRRGDQRGTDPRSTGVSRWDRTTGEFVIVSRAGGAPL